MEQISYVRVVEQFRSQKLERTFRIRVRKGVGEINKFPFLQAIYRLEK